LFIFGFQHAVLNIRKLGNLYSNSGMLKKFLHVEKIPAFSPAKRHVPAQKFLLMLYIFKIFQVFVNPRRKVAEPVNKSLFHLQFAKRSGERDVKANGCLHVVAAFIDNIILRSLSAALTPFRPKRYRTS
jgi:hypothetical protein